MGFSQQIKDKYKQVKDNLKPRQSVFVHKTRVDNDGDPALGVFFDKQKTFAEIAGWKPFSLPVENAEPKTTRTRKTKTDK